VHVKLEINQSIFLSGAVTRYTNNPCAYVISSTFHGLGSSLETRLTLGIHENSRMYAMSRGDHFRFGSVFIKKSNQTKKKKFWKKTETGSNWPVLVRFGFLWQKPVQTGLARFFWFWLGFLGFFQFCLGFFRFGSVLAWFFLVFCRFRFGSVFSVFCL